MLEKERIKDLDALLRKELSHNDYEYLPMRLDISVNKKTRILNDPKCANVGVILKLSKMLNLHPHTLLTEYQLGWDNVNYLTANNWYRDFESQKEFTPTLEDKAA